MAQLRRLVVTGATGKQGGALINALLAQSTPQFEIYALTRDKNSAKAQSLSRQPNVRVIQGDFDHPADTSKSKEIPGLDIVPKVCRAQTDRIELSLHPRLKLGYYSQHAVEKLQELGSSEPDLTALALLLKETGSTLIAYSPLCQGLLTGAHIAQLSTSFLSFI